MESTQRRWFDGRDERSTALLRAMTTIVWDADPSGEFQRQQHDWEAYTGQSMEACRGLGWLNAVHPEDRAASAAAWRTAVSSGTPAEMEHRLQRKDGGYAFMCMRAVPVRDPETQRVREWFGSHEDITHRKETELSLRAALARIEAVNAALVDASDAKSTFLATMSHELRTPLNALIGYSELLLLGIPQELPGPIRPHIERIDLSAKHLLQLIEEILTFARIEAGRERLRYELVELSGVMKEVQAVMDPLAAARGLRFVIDVPAEPIQFVTDPRKLRQILVNLLGNATKFTHRGSITLRARTRGNMVELQVQDTGVGIARDHLERIFEPFWQVDQGKTRAVGGTGLGLAVTRELAALMGGGVEVDSRQGVGTTFTVLLPTTQPTDHSSR